MQLALADLRPPTPGPEPLLELVYHGNPRVKKNSQQIVTFKDGRRPILVSSPEYRKAEKEAVRELANVLLGHDDLLPLDRDGRELRVQALFYLGKRQHPDLDGLISAAADILEAAGVLENDYRIVSWDGTRRFRDADNPRTEIAIWQEA
jgi:Holliday junction resolvase RusA-like endonuclease